MLLALPCKGTYWELTVIYYLISDYKIELMAFHIEKLNTILELGLNEIW